MGVKYVYSSAMAHARTIPLQRAHLAPPGEPLGVSTTVALHTVHDQLVGDFPLACHIFPGQKNAATNSGSSNFFPWSIGGRLVL